MDLFFEIFDFFKYDFYLSRWVKIAMDKGTEIRIYSGNDLILKETEESTEPERCYLRCALHLIEWAKRNENHASSSTREKSWLDKLKEMLPDEVDNAEEGWQLLSMHETE